MSAWKPFETAPQDGTAVILWLSRATKMVIAYRDDSTDIWFVRHGAMVVDKPTHWMPLPLPPDGALQPSPQGGSQ